MRAPASPAHRAAPMAPENYAGDAIEAMHRGDEPDPPLTDGQTRELMRSGFIARRHGARGEYFILTAKGENLAEDIAAEREFAATPRIRGGAL